VGLLDGTRTAAEVCGELRQLTGVSLSRASLAKFLAKLESYGILGGERVQGVATPETPPSQMHYVRIKLFNPDPLFSRIVPKLRWIWTTGFFAVMTSLMVLALLLTLTSASEVVSYSVYMVREHFLVIFVAGGIVGFTHESAHGLTCKAFGGRATEIGVLLFYGIVPGEYCTITGLHLIPQRSRRLWVIAAGIYWQLMVCAFSLLIWFLLAPHTLLSDTAFVFALGSGLDVAFNANPLIKLDGYYFLSQWLRMPNLMDRSRNYWRGVLKRILFGERNREAARYDRRERTIYLIFGLLSFTYNIAFASLILTYVGTWLIERFYLLGLVLAFGLALLFLRRPLKQLFDAIATVFKIKERKMADHNQMTMQATTPVANKDATPPFWRRRLVPLALALVVVVCLLLPWSASVGNYGLLVALPDREAIIRAPEAATLVQLSVKPGDQLTSGAVIGKLGNLDVEERITEVQTDLARVQADYDRLLGELRVRGETALRADIAQQQRQRDFAEIDAEQRQIRSQELPQPSGLRVITISNNRFGDERQTVYPAALAALQAETEAQRAQHNEAATQRDRLRTLHVQGLVPRSELDAQEARAATLAAAFDAARQRLGAALIEHRRRHAGTATELRLAETDTGAERLNVEKLSRELRGQRELLTTLETRREVLTRKRAQFDLTTPRAGWVFGEELTRLTGQFFQKGAEICRVADTRQLLLRVNVPEREIGDVRTGAAVRLKMRAYPDRIFRGVVSKIGGESESDSQGQTAYRVELTIENGEGMLRPGMTAFARIDFDRQMIGRILLHKLRQTLRPELWML
nr:HlyD family efflux transporter periplasmic adaptor subunit [Acidobacteriota bacterium]